jgi:hypothetical protein
MKPKIWRGLLGWGLAGVLAYFIGARLVELWPQIASQDWKPRPLPLGLSVLTLASTFIIVSLAWAALVRGMGEPLPLVSSLRIYFYVSLGRYLPGKVWTVVGASALARQEQCSGLRVGAAMVYLGFMTLQVGAFLSLVGLLFFPWGRQWDLPLPLVLALAGVVVALAFLPGTGVRLLRWALKFLGRDLPEIPLPTRTVVVVLALILLHWFLEALAFQLLIRSLYDLPWAAFPELVFSTAFSTVLGFLAFFVPAGLGVRDGALLVAFSQFMPPAIASAMCVLVRLWFTLVDVSVVLLASGLLYWLNGRRAKPGPPTAPPEEVTSPCAE